MQASNTQTSTLVALNGFVEAFMDRTGDMEYCRWDVMMSEWTDPKNQQELEKILKDSRPVEKGPKKKRKR